ncbi:beta strand repeat-containing protein, partial [Flavobacterium sp.]|uniref:beta strand repeat-containing protein n=1 Tax=Flavobacterium sp. TaxID=239 RepID=UPI003FA57911
MGFQISSLQAKLYYVLLLFVVLVGLKGQAQIYVNPITTGRPMATYYLGDKLPANTYFQFEIGQSSWNTSEVGVGQNTDGNTGWSWAAATYYADGSAPNKKVQRNLTSFQFTATGTWYAVGRAKANAGDSFTYGDEGTWSNDTSLTASTSTKSCPYYTVNALGNPTSCTATISGTTATLGWTKFTGGANTYNVMIVRYPKDATVTAPTNGNSYGSGAAIGAGTVVYVTNNGISTTNTVTTSNSYDYYFYSENWSYYSSGQKVTANSPVPTITLGTSPSVCRGTTTANLPYTATTNSPNQYSITFDTAAGTAGFTNVSLTTLPASQIAIAVPASAAAATYNGTLTVKNTTTNEVSTGTPFTVTVKALPTAGITNNTGVTKVTCSVPSISLTATGGTGYSWSDGTSVVSATANLSVTSAGTYTVTVTNNGCSSTASIVITQDTAATSSSQTVTACDTYTWSVNGATYTTSGTYTYVGTNAAGCTDTKTLNLTINNSTASSQTVTACDTYTWSVNGTTYTTSGTYSYTSTNGAGCPDTKTLNLTINNSTASSQTATACDTYTWSVNGVTYTTSGTYTYVGTTAAGCTDTKTLNLTIYVSTPSSQTVTACDTYTWSVNGATYTTSGTYVFAGTNAAGCPQNQTLYLTINNSSASSQTATACDSYTWSVNGATYTTSGTYIYTSTNGAGCPDTKTLVLTINNSTSSSQTASACDAYTWSVNGQTYTTSGTYTYTSTNGAGCPDTKTLNLTITPSSSNSTTAAACGSYTWSVNGQTYSQSGTYTSVSGCHTETLELTITPNTSNTTTATACDTYTWSVNGATYTTSGTRTVVTGCHTEILNLTINNSTSSSQTVTACNTYTWSVNGQTYTTSGTYTYTSTNGVGCTDVKTLNLTINNSTSSSQTVSACGSYTWSVNGTTYTTSGTYTNVGTNASGCSDTKTLNLTISGTNKSNATSTWTNGQNDGTIGFGAWNFSTNGTTAGFFSGSSDVNNGGTRSWGMYASGGDNVASAVRPVTMGVGNTLSFSMDNGFIDTGKVVGFGLQNTGGQNLVELLFIGGQSYYKINDNVVGFDTSIGYTTGGLDVSLTYTALNTYSITIKTKAGATVTYTGRTFAAQTGGQKPAQIRFYNAGAGSGSGYDLFFNSLAINNPVITTQPSISAQNICTGTTPTNLTVAATGSGQTYQWYSSTSNTTYAGATNLGTGAQTATLTPQNSVAGTAYYYCIVTDPCGSTYSNFSGAVTVTSPPNAGTLSGTQEVCVGGITAFSTNGTTGGSWSTSASGVASVSTAGAVTGVSAGSATITYTLNGTGGCSNATATRTVTVNPLPTAGVTNNTGSTVITCSTTSISVTATGGDSYSWSNGSTVVGTSADLTITAGGTYTVTVTNSFGCTAMASITVTENKTTTSSETATACDTYTWALNGQTYTTSGNYNYVSTNETGCVNTATLHLTINNSTSSNQTASACDTYTWSVNGQTYTESGTHSVVTGC